MTVQVHDPLPGSCFLRIDVGAFSVFVASFIPAGTRFHHAHDDLLSYVVYLNGTELLCDPGMPTYRAADREYITLGLHNGLRLPAAAFAPRPGFFVPSSLADVRLTTQRETDGALQLTVAPAVGYSKSLRVAALTDGTGLELREEIHTEDRDARAALFHCLADPAASIVAPSVVHVAGAELQYDGVDTLDLRGFARARTYGERLECAALRGSARLRLITRLRHV